MGCWRDQARVQAQVWACLGDGGTQVTSGHEAKGEPQEVSMGGEEGGPGPEVQKQTREVREARSQQSPLSSVAPCWEGPWGGRDCGGHRRGAARRMGGPSGARRCE